jgi:hypothetical protein
MTMYAKRIDTLRRIVAVTFAISLPGWVACVSLGLEAGTIVLGVSTAASLVVAFFLFLEYLIRSYVKARPKGLTGNQFTVAELLILVTLLAMSLSCYKVLGELFWPLALVLLIFVACTVEVIRRSLAAEETRIGDRDDASDDSAASPSSDATRPEGGNR